MASQLPSTIHASAQARLDHQQRMMDRGQLYVHPPEFEREFEKLMRMDERPPPPRPYHDDWKS